jgi:hypothetical protein
MYIYVYIYTYTYMYTYFNTPFDCCCYYFVFIETLRAKFIFFSNQLIVSSPCFSSGLLKFVTFCDTFSYFDLSCSTFYCTGSSVCIHTLEGKGKGKGKGKPIPLQTWTGP